MRHTLLALLFISVATGCGTPSRAPAQNAATDEPIPELDAETTLAGRPLTEGETRTFEPLLAAAQRIRGLRFVRPVPTRVQSETDIVEFVRSHLDRDELEHARVFYVALGLLTPELDVERMMLSVMGEQIVGYYDPEAHTMVVREDIVRDLMRAGDLARDESALAIVHEYVHALQDQHLGLAELQDIERSIDGDNAFAALVEGDATLSMIGLVADAQGQRLSSLTRDPSILAGIINTSSGMTHGSSELLAAPSIVRAPLLSRYLGGLVFCATLHGRGGFRWIDEAFGSPPQSTEQVLHPDRWLTRDTPEEIQFAEWDELVTAGYRVHDEDTLGELELSIYLAQSTGEDRNLIAGEGWGGDRLRVYSGPNGQTAAIWFTTWDDEREAIEAEAAALRVRDLAPESRRATHRVRRVGRAVLIIRDLEPTLHGPIETSFEGFARSLPIRR
jgi:hypothetical protein